MVNLDAIVVLANIRQTRLYFPITNALAYFLSDSLMFLGKAYNHGVLHLDSTLQLVNIRLTNIRFSRTNAPAYFFYENMTPFEKIKLEHLYLEIFMVFLMFASKVVTSKWSPVWLSALLENLRLTR